MEKDCCARYKKMPRSEEQLKTLRSRMNRIAGQVAGIQRMLDDNRYCGDILTQIAAVESVLQSVGYLVLQEHMRSCVAEGVREGRDEMLDEAVDLMKKLK